MADKAASAAASVGPGVSGSTEAAVTPPQGRGRFDRFPFNRLPFVGRQRWHLLTRRDKFVLALMVGIPLAIDIALIWGSLVIDFIWSFTDWQGQGDFTGGGFGHRVVGLQNYTQLFDGTYPFFWSAVLHNLFWLAFLMFVATPLGILLAVILDGQIKGMAFYRTVFYLPVVLSLALIGIIWQLQYAPDWNRGFIDGTLHFVGYDVPVVKDLPLVGQWFRDVSKTDWVGGPLAIVPTVIAATWRHVGYICILYLAGLKSFDPALREAAAIDGANARQTFFQVVFPVMKPINIVIVVITTIEALRAFDLVYIINYGRSPMELLSTLITNNAISESNRIGFGAALAVILAVVSLVPIIGFLIATTREQEAVSAASTARPSAMKPGHRRVKRSPGGPLCLPDHDHLRLAGPVLRGGLRGAAQQRGHDQERDLLHRAGSQPRQLHPRLGPNHADIPAGVLQHSGCDDTGGDHRPHRRIDDCLRRFQVQLALQPCGPDAVHGG